ncbi:hypothetical protein [Pelomonas cellulosilytica]|uniref:Uncharacterized protein n=1 Tax=Pelomonas cellulosilytica TaxID=2906762 RepID=A0ABS8XK11_9BURK|nr:hypothetical protein [Pelomonas sp. P8]MCE4553187.1 hypothetical protein [Pelomonas sp. P8]
MASRVPAFGAAALASLAFCASMAAAEPPTELPAVEVRGESRAPREQKTVADLLAVQNIFERERSTYAPQAELRIRVLPRHDTADLPALELRHGDQREPVVLDALGRFAIPRAWRQLPPDAIVRSPLPAGRLAWAVDVRTPDLAPDTRRLGDLRLECRADLYGGALARGIKPPTFYALRVVSDVCTSRQVQVGFFTDRPVWAVSLSHAGRHAELPERWMHGSVMGQTSRMFPLLDWPYALRDRFVVLPADKWQDWPHDAVVELEGMTQ